MFKQYQLLFLLALCASCSVGAMELQNAVPADGSAVEQKNNDEQLPSLDRRGMRNLLDKKIRGYDLPAELESTLATHLIKTCDSVSFFENARIPMKIISQSVFRHAKDYFDSKGKSLRKGLCRLLYQGTEHAWSSDNKYIVSYTRSSGKLLVWNTETDDIVKHLTTYNNQSFAHMLFLPNTHRIIAANRDQKCLDIWDIESGSCVENIPLDQDFACTLLSCDNSGRYLLIGGVMGSGVWECTCATLWDLERHQTVHRLSFSANNDAHCTAIAWSDNGQMLAIATRDIGVAITGNVNVQVYDITTAECIKTITYKSDWINSIGWLCKDTILAVAQKQTQSIAFWAPFSENHSFFTTFDMQGGNLGLAKVTPPVDCSVNRNRCAILYDSRNGSFLMKVFDFSAIEQIYDYLYNGKIFLDQAMLLTAIENSKLNYKKYALDRKSKEIFDRLPEEIQHAYANHVIQQPSNYYTTLYTVAKRYIDTVLSKALDNMRIG